MRARLSSVFMLAASVIAPSLAAASLPAEEFFIVSSVDATKKTMVVKRPTEVTLTMRLTDRTRCRSEQDKPIQLADLRAGDTVFIVSVPDPSGLPVASSPRKGPMTGP